MKREQTGSARTNPVQQGSDLTDAQRRRIRMILQDVKNELIDVEEGVDHIEQAVRGELGEPYDDEAQVPS